MLSSTFVRIKAGRFVPVIFAALFLAGCPSQAPQTPPVNIQDSADASSAYYLQQMQQSRNDNKADWQLLAIRALLREGDTSQALQLLGTLPQKLSATQRTERQLLIAEVRIAQQDRGAANAVLAQIDPTMLSINQQVRYYQVQIAANQGGSSLALVRAYIAQEPLLSGQARQDNIDQTWQALLSLTPATLSNLTINANENVLQGWLDLLHVYQDNRQDAALLQAGIKDWQTRYPQNPAAQMMPKTIGQVQVHQPSSTKQIALLLPINGQAQVFAQTIEQGFTAARNGLTMASPMPVTDAVVEALDQPIPQVEGNLEDGVVSTPAYSSPAYATTAPVNPAPVVQQNVSVKVYDTSSQPLETLLAQAQQDGATLVVGPLLKNNVEQLANSTANINILALNQPENIVNKPNVCYFALSPEDEARDAARHIYAQGKLQPLLLVPRGVLGNRVAKAFTDEWNSQGGHTVLQQNFGAIGELRQAINSGAGISLSGQPVVVSSSTQPAASSEDQFFAINDGISTPSIGGNIDAVYIVATPDEMTLLKPMIEMRTSSNSKPALFASSRSYQAGSGPDYRLELEGVQFSDIPLLAGADPALLQQATALFKNDYSLVRLYAMGIDAWALANHFDDMRQTPGFRISGSTGELSATPQCVITRKLPWLQYRQGMIVPVS